MIIVTLRELYPDPDFFWHWLLLDKGDQDIMHMYQIQYHITLIIENLNLLGKICSKNKQTHKQTNKTNQYKTT